MRRLVLLSTVFALCSAATQTMAASTAYVISTFKNGQPIGTSKINVEDLRHETIALTSVFQEIMFSYDVLVGAAKGMTAKDRCNHLITLRVTMASVEFGILDASANAEEMLKNAIKSIEEVNGQTQVTCEIRVGNPPVKS